MQKHTKEELEGYLEYSKMLWDKIEKKFNTDNLVKMENAYTDDKKAIIDNYVKAVSEVMSPIKQAVFNSTMLSFNEWLYSDCPLTGHKGREIPAPSPVPSYAKPYHSEVRQ